MLARERSPMPRRGFLSGLASLPLIGGGVALIGQPTAAATPVTDTLLWSYKAWLYQEHRALSTELAGHDKDRAESVERCFKTWVPPDQHVPGINWHADLAHRHGGWPSGWIDAPQPSSRAAVILSAAGVPLTGDDHA